MYMCMFMVMFMFVLALVFPFIFHPRVQGDRIFWNAIVLKQISVCFMFIFGLFIFILVFMAIMFVFFAQSRSLRYFSKPIGPFRDQI